MWYYLQIRLQLEQACICWIFLFMLYFVSLQGGGMKINMRILGIDYGDVRVGVAVSDIMGWTAQGVGTVKNRGIDNLIAELDKIIKEYMPEKIIIGMPKNMDGTLGFRADVTYEFADKLKEIYNGEIIFRDERLTTVGATRYLNESNTRGKNRKGIIDTVSACLILEGYLNSQKNS